MSLGTKLAVVLLLSSLLYGMLYVTVCRSITYEHLIALERTAVPATVEQAHAATAERVALYGALCAVGTNLVVLLVVLVLMGRTVGRPIRTLAQAMAAIGNYRPGSSLAPPILPVRRGDELGLLARKIERAARHLARRAEGQRRAKEALHAAQDELEARVSTRTRDLADMYRALQEEVAERARVEEQLHHAQKMEAVGRLAGGVAHDFNNLLTIITGYSEILLQEERLDMDIRSDIAEIEKAADRASTLTRQLLAFSRRQVLQPTVVNVNNVIGEIGKMLRRLIGEDIELVTALDPMLGPALVDPGQLEQVIVNLAVNARDAMPGGGLLTIATASVELNDEYASLHMDVRPGRYAVIAVSDNGCGMDRETQRRIFEPFFTTKESGKGTGLGLSTVYGILKQSGGHISVYSEPGQGTTFRVYLPHAVTADEASRTVEPTLVELPGGTERILLVEDEPHVRSLARRVLEGKGYEVVEAEGAFEALRRIEGDCVAPDLLLTDIVMPRMNGPDLCELVGTLCGRAVPVLFMSGYAESTVLQQDLIGAGAAFMPKPFTPQVLLKRVRECLDN